MPLHASLPTLQNSGGVVIVAVVWEQWLGSSRFVEAQCSK